MNKRKISVVAAILLCGLLLAGGVLAGASGNYRLDWFIPLTGGGGGGPTRSANYGVNLTVGQTAIGAAASSNYQACLGYWCGAGGGWYVYLPLVVRAP